MGPLFRPISEKLFRPIMRYVDGQKFDLELGSEQVEQLVRLFVSAASAHTH